MRDTVRVAPAPLLSPLIELRYRWEPFLLKAPSERAGDRDWRGRIMRRHQEAERGVLKGLAKAIYGYDSAAAFWSPE